MFYHQLSSWCDVRQSGLLYSEQVIDEARNSRESIFFHERLTLRGRGVGRRKSGPIAYRATSGRLGIAGDWKAMALLERGSGVG